MEEIARSPDLKSFQIHCQQSPKQETLGLLCCIDDDVELNIFPNISDRPLESFMATAAAVRLADRWQQEGKRLIICHSHPQEQPQKFSEADMRTIRAWNCEGLLFVGADFGEIKYFDGRLHRPTLECC